jgi:DNA-directed RNA polymerase specialized sigma subunit
LSRLEREYEEPFNAWKTTPTPETTGHLLRTLNPVLSVAIKTYAPTQSSPVLKSRAKSIALNALGAYDPAKASLRTHLMQNLQRLRRVGGQYGQIIKVPERVVLDRRKLDDANLQLTEDFGRPPTDNELGDHLGMPLKRMREIRLAVRPLASGRFQGAEEADTGHMPAVTDLVDNSDAWVRFVYDDLRPRDRFILERSLGMNGTSPMSPLQIAKTLQISPAAVSQRMAYIQKMLDRREEVGLL